MHQDVKLKVAITNARFLSTMMGKQRESACFEGKSSNQNYHAQPLFSSISSMPTNRPKPTNKGFTQLQGIKGIHFSSPLHGSYLV